MKRAALYLRVSTDEQTTENQRQELMRVAAQRGWTIAGVYEDAGISGAKGRDKRPGLDALMKASTRGHHDVVMAWAVDRLGRSLQDLVGTLHELHAAGVDLFLHQQAIDTTTPTGRAMFGMLGVFAEFERSMIQARVKAGIERARGQGKRLGRPPVARQVRADILAALEAGGGIVSTARRLQVGTSTVQKVKAAMIAALPSGST